MADTFSINSLAPGGVVVFLSVIPKHMLWIKFLGISREIALWWIPQNIFDD